MFLKTELKITVNFEVSCFFSRRFDCNWQEYGDSSVRSFPALEPIKYVNQNLDGEEKNTVSVLFVFRALMIFLTVLWLEA